MGPKHRVRNEGVPGSNPGVGSGAFGMKLNFSDYDGPTGLFVATGTEILPLDSAAGAVAFVGAAMQSGTIDPEESAAIQAAVEAAMRSGESERDFKGREGIPHSPSARHRPTARRSPGD